MRTVRSVSSQQPTGPIRTDLKVYGMKDATAAQAAYDVLGSLDGVQQVHLDIARRRITVLHDPVPGLAGDIIQRLRQLGFRVMQKACCAPCSGLVPHP